MSIDSTAVRDGSRTAVASARESGPIRTVSEDWPAPTNWPLASPATSTSLSAVANRTLAPAGKSNRSRPFERPTTDPTVRNG
ncbi:hypothetical protein DP107_08795 [Haloglomus irregulare]|uniref:Uncharacterized protein n=1 Tax=Haloglomus irregulare TaxID=2234134 RepID=A0A554NAE9_9EURY|nr:hypothetical protein [Haloglomus irregulare]TSD14335.1 hypothetical protein DP107_08795 [Haloglomus irregulare]